ncbi:MAG: malate synthase A [Ilumatobacteraceae bacterium]
MSTPWIRLAPECVVHADHAGAAAVPTAEVLTAEALDLVAVMQRSHDHARRLLLERRAERAARLRSGEQPGLLAETAWIRDGDWQVRPAPTDLTDRRCEITGPCDRKMMISALNSGARVFMADLEDSLSPTWANVIEGQRNLRDASDATISFTRPDGSVDTLAATTATLVVRSRGLHMTERHVAVDDREVSASLFDVTLAAFHCAARATARGSGLYLYLPKIESHHEAEWWDAVLADLERRLGLPYASIRVTVLIETILAAYEMEEILYALRDRVTGLNAGRWDYIFSVIKKVGGDPAHVLPDRASVTMTVPFMAAYAQRLVAICHRRGAHAIGGMSAFIPNRRKPDVTERAIAAVRADKQREAGLGYDGTWVAHPDLVEVATAVFDATLGARPNQLEVMPAVGDDAAAMLDTAIPGSAVTAAGVRGNVDVSLQYLEAWLGGRGAVAIHDLMEDAATAEISRSQLWQWVHHGVVLDDGAIVTAAMVAAEIDAVGKRLIDDGLDAGRIHTAMDLLRNVVLAAELPDFLVLLAEARLVDTPAT